MKKFIIPILACVCVATLFTSCKKDYTCTCTWTDNTGAQIAKQTYTFKDTKSNAEKACNNQVSTSSYGTTVTGKCSL